MNISDILINRKSLFSGLVKFISPLSIVLLILFFSVMNSNFISPLNIRNLLTDMAPLLIVGCGISFVLIVGSIDLSIGSIASCSAVIVALLIPKIGYAAFPVSLLYGLAAGLLNGWLYTKVKIPSFIVTLGTMSIWQSAAYLLSGGAPLLIPPKYWPMVKWIKLRFGIISMPLILSLTVMGLLYLVQRKTVTGKYSYAVGVNERAARMAGVDVVKTKMTAFAVCGLLSGASGMLLSAKLNSGIPTVGEPITLMAIATAALGGISLSGGKGTVLSALLGACLVIVIQNGMNLIAVNTYWQQIVFGSLVISALYLTMDKSVRGRLVK